MTDRIQRHTTRLAALVLGATLSIGAIAQDDFPTTPPAGGEPKDFTLPDKQHYALDNGLRVTLIPFGSIPKVTISARLMVGNLNDGEDTWLADLTADLMEEGTTNRSAIEVAREAAEMGGDVSIGVGLDQTFVTGNALADFAPAMIGLVGDVLRNPAFPESEIERLHRDAIRNVEVALTNPNTMALVAFREALYGDHPYGRLYPSIEQIQGYDAAKIRSFFDANFGAQRTHVFVAGMFDEARVREAIEAAFGDWEAGPEPLVLPPEPAQERQYVDLINRADASQSNVYVGLPVIDPSHPDYVALQATNAILGGSFSSRITSNIREDKGYTYSPYSTVSTRRSDGYWAQVAAVTTDDTAPALKEIFFEINRLRDEPPSDEELTAIQNYMAGIFTLQNSTRDGIINVLNQVDLHGQEDSYLTEYVSRVYALDAETISKIATDYLRPEDMTVVVVGDRARVGESLVPYLEPAN